MNRLHALKNQQMIEDIMADTNTFTYVIKNHAATILQPDRITPEYWSNDDGWTSLEEATHFHLDEIIQVSLPIGGTWETHEAALKAKADPILQGYDVYYNDRNSGEAVFRCLAEDTNHADEQARNAYPLAEIRAIGPTASWT